jgi:bifunctional non-homologous end joining protein LigD
MPTPPKPRKAVEELLPATMRGIKEGPLPGAIEPQLATLVDVPPAGDDWVHEVKFDGYRLLARLDRGKVRLFTRRGNDWTSRIATLPAAFSELAVESALIDGELVVLNEKGDADFQALQNTLSLEGESALSFCAFDLLYLNGFDLRGAPLIERKAVLKALLEARADGVAAAVRFSDHVVGSGRQFLEEVRKMGLEGIISKRAGSSYRSGRTREWLKIKCHLRQEFIVVGYTEPQGSRAHFGSLAIALLRDGVLTYCGKVGTGFNDASLREIMKKLVPLEVGSLTLANPPKGVEARGVHWVKPALLAEVSYGEITGDGHVRHPVFHGLREDKPATEAKLEKAVPTASTAADNPVPKRSAAARTKAKRAVPRSLEPSPATVAYQKLAAEYPLTNRNKVLYPEKDITKGEVLEYYALVAERMLPHVANRPLTLVRCPNGWNKQCFFQKHPKEGVPVGLRSVAIRESEGKLPYSVLDDALGLFGLVQLGALEIHTWGARADDFEHADLLVFDLDPDEGLEFTPVVKAARRLREVFETAKLESFVKSTGGKGLHVCIPIVPGLEWDQVKAFCGYIAEAMEQEAPDKYTANISKAARKGRIFIDYLRNGRGATFIAPYSTRARANAPVAVPLEWDELDGLKQPPTFTIRTLKERLVTLSRDPFERMATLKQRLPAV